VLNYQYVNDKGYSRSYDYNYGNGEIELNENLQSHSILALVPLKIGTGRIDPVQDARHAVYLFDELSKIQRLSSDMSDEQIIEFATLISQLKNKRFFDSRLKSMEELESLDSFLVSNNYVSEQDVKYFATLSDFWDYGNRPLRNSGTRLSAAIQPGYYFFDYNYNDDYDVLFGDDKYNVSAFLLHGGIDFKHEKPINLRWQNTVDLHCYAGIFEGKRNDKNSSVGEKIRIPEIQIGYYQTIGFYPNTRTDISFRYSLQYVQLFDKKDVQNDIRGVEANGAKAATNLFINYYISPKFRLNVTSSLFYILQESEDQAMINFNNVAGSNYLLGNSTSDANGYSNYYRPNEFVNRFSVSLIYSIF
jgi:hypothetical protein